MQTDFLFDTALVDEHQVVFQEHGLLLACLAGSQFHKDENAVISAYLYIGCLRTIGIVEIDAVDIHPIARLITTTKTDTFHTDARIILIIHPEGIG